MKRLSSFYTDAIMWASVYFLPTFPAILAIGFFVVADMITGAIASNKRGEPFQSKKLKNTVTKFAAYGITILVARVFEQEFLQGFAAMKLVAGFIAYIELKSLNENVETITGYNIFKTILKRVKP